MTEIIFFTSNPVKIAHARHLCRDYDVQITGFREKTFRANYVEPRIYDRTQLLDLSYRDALERWRKAYPGGDNKLFLLEDTSVIIEALSTERETPGLDVKYWMAETDFSKLDAQLKALGNNRRATVRSDLILHLPRELRDSDDDKGYKRFSSSVAGAVVEKDREFDTNPMYPWLDNRTFNKWFVPIGCHHPISTLPIKKADKFDFRAPAFREMLTFLENHQRIHRRTQTSVQTSFDFDIPLFVVCGPSCAGKTTLAEHLAEQHGYLHIEASDFMYLSYYQRHGVASSVKIGDFAEQALRKQPEIVAEQILRNIKLSQSAPIVITGFRALGEFDWFRRHYSGKFPIVPIYVAADSEVRYARAVKRQREGEAENQRIFIRRDKQQFSMGLEKIEKEFGEGRIENNGSLESFFHGFDLRYGPTLPKGAINSKKVPTAEKLENLILLTLSEEWQSRKYFTTTEIAQSINLRFHLGDKPKSKNNISRYFNQAYYPYYEIKLIDGKRKYRLSNTGYGEARLLQYKCDEKD